MKRNFLKTKIIKVNRVRVDKMFWNCPKCTFKNKNTEDKCGVCWNPYLLKNLMTTSAFADENDLVELIEEISRIFFPICVSLAFIKEECMIGKTEIISDSSKVTNASNVIQIGYEAPKNDSIENDSIVGHYVLIRNYRVIDLGQYAQEPIKNSSIPNAVFDEYQHFLKNMEWDRKSLGSNFGNSCLPMVLLFGVFMLKHDMALDQKAEEIQKSLQLEEKEKLSKENKDAELAAVLLAHSLDTQEYQELLERKEKDHKMAKSFQEEEDAKFAEWFAKMGLSD